MSQNPNLAPHPRALIDEAERAALEKAGGIVLDGRRSRPRYFDGRFLAASDLTADQDYIRQRQIDLARAAGWGVIRGLDVRPGRTRNHELATQVVVGVGHGLTPSGIPVSLGEQLTVDLLDLHQSSLLDAHLGLRQSRASGVATRHGAFVLALRPVEYTSTPRRGYPTTVTGTPTTEDYETIEATALTLIPWPESLAGDANAVRRALVREIFVAQHGRGLPANLLPLAMVYLDGVSVRWVDTHLVRRPLGAEQGDVLGFSVISRAVRASHVQQYRAQIREVVSAAGSRPFAAADFFDALPPVGELPAASLDRSAFSQVFFPPEVDVDLSFVPEDELALLVEESLLLPPIDLASGADALYGTSVLILVPVPRAKVRQFKAKLETIRRALSLRVGRVPVARTPILALQRLRLPTVTSLATAATTVETVTTADSAWSELLTSALGSAGNGLIWYARRRNMNYRADIEGDVVDIDPS